MYADSYPHHGSDHGTFGVAQVDPRFFFFARMAKIGEVLVVAIELKSQIENIANFRLEALTTTVLPHTSMGSSSKGGGAVALATIQP